MFACPVGRARFWSKPKIVVYLLVQMYCRSVVSALYRSKLLPAPYRTTLGRVSYVSFKVLENAWCFEVHKARVGFS